MTPRGGEIPQAEGATFEELLEWVHKGYLARGRAAIYHNKVAGKFIGPGKFIPDPDLARPDYSGTLFGGISVHFDVKTINDTVGWMLPGDRIHQYTELLEQAKMGAIAFFLVESRAAAAVYILRVDPTIPVEGNRPKILFADTPVADGRLEKRVDHHYKHSATRIPVFCIPAVDGTYDWLTAIERFWLGRSSVPPRPVGRPTENKDRDEMICRLRKTHSSRELQRNFHLSKYRINAIVRNDPAEKSHSH